MEQNAPLLSDAETSVDKSLDYSAQQDGYSSTELAKIKHEPGLDCSTPINVNNKAPLTSKRKLLGLLCCVISITCWISVAHVVKDFQDDDNDEQYDKPFAVMWLSCGAYILIFAVWYLMKVYSNFQNLDIKFASTSNNFCHMLKTLWVSALILAAINLYTEFTWAWSLNETMVSVNTAVFQSCVAVVYVLSIIFLDLKFAFSKLIGVILCVVGVVGIAYGEYKAEIDAHTEDDVDNTIKGIMVVIISMFLNSIMMVGIEYVSTKHFTQNKQTQDLFFLQSMMGLFILLVYWPTFFIFDSLDIEEFELPTTKNQWIIIVISVLLNLGFFGAFFLSIVLTNAFFTQVLLLFVLPVGFVSDVIIYSYQANMWIIGGTMLIVIGFVLLEFPIVDYISKYRKTQALT